jgi:hypothetical protein
VPIRAGLLLAWILGLFGLGRHEEDKGTKTAFLSADYADGADFFWTGDVGVKGWRGGGRREVNLADEWRFLWGWWRLGGVGTRVAMSFLETMEELLLI